MVALSFEGAEPTDSAFLWGFVSNIADDSFTISSAKEPIFLVSVKLLGNRFTYGDPREAETSEEKVRLEAKYICAISYVLPTGGKLTIAELRM